MLQIRHEPFEGSRYVGHGSGSVELSPALSLQKNKTSKKTAREEKKTLVWVERQGSCALLFDEAGQAKAAKPP